MFEFATDAKRAGCGHAPDWHSNLGGGPARRQLVLRARAIPRCAESGVDLPRQDPHVRFGLIAGSSSLNACERNALHCEPRKCGHHARMGDKDEIENRFSEHSLLLSDLIHLSYYCFAFPLAATAPAWCARHPKRQELRQEVLRRTAREPLSWW